MTDTLTSLRRTIDSANDLDSIVRTMKVMAASRVAEYQLSVRALADYYRAVELGLSACLRRVAPHAADRRGDRNRVTETAAVIFGSEQGLVGQFNEQMAEFAATALHKLSGKETVWVVGERVRPHLEDLDVTVAAVFTLPNSLMAITPLVGRILAEIEKDQQNGGGGVLIFHNRPAADAPYEPASQRLLPLDRAWRRDLMAKPWPTALPPEVMNAADRTMGALVREYLFVSLFKACAESLACENASRLAAMQRAENNIGERLQDLTRTFHRLRQSAIDEELFDVVSGFEALR
jgi:F-type H+-transporting ATPase subunit gamma